MNVADKNNRYRSVMVLHIVGGSAAPAIAAGTAAGTGPTIAIAGNDLAGTITITTGTSPAASNAVLATVTFIAPFGDGKIPRVGIAPANAAAAALSGATSCFVDQSQVTVALFKLIGGSSALAGSTTYVFNYSVTG